MGRFCTRLMLNVMASFKGSTTTTNNNQQTTTTTPARVRSETKLPIVRCLQADTLFFFKKLQFCNQNCLSKIAVACLADKIGANRFTYLYFFIVGATELLDISSDISSCRLSGKRRAPISLPCISVCAIMSSSYHMAMSLFQPLPTAAQLESDRHHI